MQRVRKLFRSLWFASGLAVVSVACAATASASNDSGATGPELQAPKNVRSMVLPHFEPDLPMAPGRNDSRQVCVSCHSPRYVMMQPLFSRPVWEQTVDKMAKVYGAEMDSKQRASIIDYLVTIHGPNSAAASDDDDDANVGSAGKSAAPPESVPSLTFAVDSTGRQKEVTRGAELFASNCAACHGNRGRGDGFVGQVLLRKPKNLAAIRFSLKLLTQVLWNGKPGTAMPSWRTVPPQDLSALAVYVQTLHPPDQNAAISPECLAHGNQVFLHNCAPCHGVAGDGKGTAAATLLPQPANFRLKQPDFDYILTVVREGIPGTAMPAWKDLISESDRQAVAGFVRTLFEAGESSQP